MLLPNIRIALCALLLPLLCVLAQLVSLGEGVQIEEIVVPATVQQKENVFIDAKQLRTFIVGEIAKDLTANRNKKLTLTEKAIEVRIGLLANLFPEPTEEKGQEVQQLRNKINGIFEDSRFDDTALPEMIMHRIDQLALRPHMEELVKELDEADAADEDKIKRMSEEKQKEMETTENSAGSSSNDDIVLAHSLPDESDLRTQRQSVKLYRAVQAAITESSSSSTKHIFVLASKHLEMVVDELTVEELARKVGIQLRVHYGEMELEDKQKDLKKFVVNSSARNVRWIWRWNNPKLLYNFFKGVAYNLRKISSDVRFAHLKIVTKIRLFFYHWLYELINHLDYYGFRRAELYHADPKAYEHVSGQAFELYLVEWLHNNVLNPLGQRIIRDLFDHQGSWEPVLPFCVHMSLRSFFNYAERLELDEPFSLQRLILSDPDVSMVKNFLYKVIEKLTREGKTVKQLVKLIRDEIFVNLSLSDGASVKSRLEEALLDAANDMGEAATNVAGDPKVLLQFFIAFYRELNKLASPEWLQTLLNNLTQELKTKEEVIKVTTDDEHAALVVKQEQHGHRQQPHSSPTEHHDHLDKQHRIRFGKEPTVDGSKNN